MTTTTKQRQQLNDAGDLGAITGLIGGGAAGYKGIKGYARAKNAAGASRGFYSMSRAAGGGRLKTAAKIARSAPAALKAPKTPVTAGALTGGWLGAVGGSMVGNKIGYESMRRRQAKQAVNKSADGLSAFGIEH